MNRSSFSAANILYSFTTVVATPDNTSVASRYQDTVVPATWPGISPLQVVSSTIATSVKVSPSVDQNNETEATPASPPDGLSSVTTASTVLASVDNVVGSEVTSPNIGGRSPVSSTAKGQ